MKGKILLGMGIVLVAFAAILMMPGSHAATINVPNDYASIYEAVNHSNNGDTVRVYAGTYDETTTIEVNKTITIQGNGTDTIVNGKGLTILFNVTADNVNITGFTIWNATEGITVSANYTDIYDCTLKNNTYGVYFNTGNHSKVRNCIIENNTKYGVYLGGENYLEVYNNTIRNNTQYGVYLYYGSYHLIANNTIEYNGNGDDYGGIYVGANLRSCIVGNNIHDNNQDGVYFAGLIEGTDSTKLHYNNFKDNVAYGVETAQIGVNAQYNCWYNTTASAWGGTPSCTGVDNISSGVNATPHYKGYVTNAYAEYVDAATNTINITSGYDANIVYKAAAAKWFMFADFSTIPYGSVSGYTPLRLYKAFNTTFASTEWINISLYYDTSDFPAGTSESRIKGIWHYNISSGGWEQAPVTGKNTTANYAYANFTYPAALSPILVMSNKLPDPEFTYTPANPKVGDVVYFDATNSTDPDGYISTYRWDFGDTNRGGGVKISHVYNSAGDYDVVLTVTDNAGDTETYTKTINISAYTPVTPGIGVAVGSGQYTLTVNIVYSNGLPASGAIVKLYGGNILLGTATTTNGIAAFNNVEGIYKITAEKDGYKTAVGYVTVSSDTSATLILSKERVSVSVAGMTYGQWAIAILILLGLITTIMTGVGGAYKKHYKTALLFYIFAFILAVVFPFASLITFNWWYAVIPLILILLTIGINWDEFRRDMQGW